MVAVYEIILNPAFVLTLAPVGFAVPPSNPAADAVAYPTPSILKVLESPPAFQHHAT